MRLVQGHFERVSFSESLTQSIGLLLSTRLGGLLYRPDYGCAVWDKSFSDLHAANKAEIRAALRDAINQHEKRLYNVSVSFEPAPDGGGRALGIEVTVRGDYKENGVEQQFDAVYRLG